MKVEIFLVSVNVSICSIRFKVLMNLPYFFYFKPRWNNKFYMNKLFALLIFVACLSCVDDTAVPVAIADTPPKLVLFATIEMFEPGPLPPGVIIPVDANRETQFLITLSKTSNLLDSIKPVVEAAEILLYRNGQLSDTAVYVDSLMQYSCTCLVKPSDVIRIVAYKEGFAPVEAQTVIPTRVTIERVALKYNAYTTENNMTYHELSLTFSDPESEVNFYELSASPGDCLNTSESFISSLPYYPPDYDVWAVSLNDLYFTDETFNGEVTTVVAYFYTGSYVQEGRFPQEIYLRSISEGYYRYKTSSLEQHYMRRSSSYFKQSEPVEVYTNVKNGYGMFGALQSSTKHLMIVDGEIHNIYE